MKYEVYKTSEEITPSNNWKDKKRIFSLFQVLFKCFNATHFIILVRRKISSVDSKIYCVTKTYGSAWYQVTLKLE